MPEVPLRWRALVQKLLRPAAGPLLLPKVTQMANSFPLRRCLQLSRESQKMVKLPVTVNFEGRYAADPEIIGQNVRRLLELRIVGFNFEDQVVDGPGLYGVEDQAARLLAARRSADSTGVPAFINARTGVFLKADQGTAHADLVDEALVREKHMQRPALTAFSFLD